MIGARRQRNIPRGDGRCRSFTTVLVCTLALSVVARHASADTPATTLGRSDVDVKRVITPIAERVSPSTVCVLFRERPVALGVIVSADGLAVTKASVLPDDLSCRLSDGRVVAASVVKRDQPNDLALIQLAANGLTPIHRTDDERTGNHRPDADRPISPGQFVISVLQAVEPESASDQSGDKPQEPRLVATLGVVSTERRAIEHRRPALGIGVETRTDRIVVAIIHPNSAALSGGMHRGDRILSIDDRVLSGPGSLLNLLQTREPGDQIRIEVERSGEPVVLAVTLKHPAATKFRREEFEDGAAGRLSDRRTGFANVLQHDGVLTPDAVGGPLLDLSNRCVGINIARAGRTASYAIPMSSAWRLVHEFQSGQEP